jgi:outer membrane protein OmpU
MKSILLASVSAFAFAGAAAADVAWSGSASATYNSNDGVSTAASLTASASVAGGWTLTTTLDGFSIDDAVVSATDGTSTLTFGADHGFGAAGLDDEDADDETVDVTVSTSMGGVDVTVTMDDGDDGNTAGNTELGVSTSAGGADVSAGFVVLGDDQGDYSLSVSTSAGGADLTFATSSVGGTVGYDITAGMSVSGIDVTVTIDEEQAWTVGGSYAMGDLTLSLGTSSAAGNDYDLGVEYAMGDISVAFTTDEEAAWTASVDYASGAITAGVSMESGENAEITLSYDLGGGAVVSAGMVADGTYAALAYDLGGGAELVASYASADITDSHDAGTTVGVSFDF